MQSEAVYSKRPLKQAPPGARKGRSLSLFPRPESGEKLLSDQANLGAISGG